jgi:hypothetical protein
MKTQDYALLGLLGIGAFMLLRYGKEIGGFFSKASETAGTTAGAITGGAAGAAAVPFTIGSTIGGELGTVFGNLSNFLGKVIDDMRPYRTELETSQKKSEELSEKASKTPLGPTPPVLPNGQRQAYSDPVQAQYLKERIRQLDLELARGDISRDVYNTVKGAFEERGKWITEYSGVTQQTNVMEQARIAQARQAQALNQAVQDARARFEAQQAQIAREQNARAAAQNLAPSYATSTVLARQVGSSTPLSNEQVAAIRGNMTATQWSDYLAARGVSWGR